MLKLFDRSDNSLVVLKIKLNKVFFLFKVALITTIDIFSPLSNINSIRSKNI